MSDAKRMDDIFHGDGSAHAKPDKQRTPTINPQERALEEERVARKLAEAERDDLAARELAARLEAEAANRMKDEFLAVVSHELRTPLNAMLGWIQLLRSGTVSEARRERALETIERAAKAQAQLVDDLLDVSRIVSGKLRIDARPVELAPVVEAAVDTARRAANAKKLRLEVDIDAGGAPLIGDPHRLQQMVWNLLSNAIKFTPSGGTVRVRLERSPAKAVVSVSDTGEGLDASVVPRVFDRFWQAEGVMNRKHGGLGLGLTLVRHIAELHGGTVRAESPGPGDGATFTVELPLPGRGEEREASGPTTPRPARSRSTRLDGLRVLLVEDEADARDLLVMMLEEHGAKVTAVSSAAEALAAMESAAPDVLVSDIAMPVIDGYALIRRIRSLESEHGAPIPAVALTAYARGEDRQSALEAGYQVHVPKPVDPEDLAAVLAKLTRDRASRS
ncbi:MAG: response regulator [Polyangiaceae bacterium]|nr:ATP-binding protein [Polyangiaceae bacterium]NUQ77064.1 response regulator [Polyangiaceae bacterium]